MNDKKIPPAVAEYAVMEISKEKSMACSDRGKAAITRDYPSKSAGEAWLWQDLRSKYGDESAAEEGFYAGWQAALKQPSASVAQWVPIGERLPELSGLVLVYRPAAHQHPACDANVTIKPYSETLGFGGSHKVTHWMPLPAHPACQSSIGEDQAPNELIDAVNWLDDFVARCNGDDRGACESVNVIRHALQARAQLVAPAGVPSADDMADRFISWPVPTFCAYCGGNDEEPQWHCADCTAPTLVSREMLHESLTALDECANLNRHYEVAEQLRALLNGGRS